MTQQRETIDMHYDRSDLRRVILSESEQFAQGFAAVEAASIDPTQFRGLTNIMVSGMGGSALPANVLRIYLGNLFRKSNATSSHALGVYQNRFYTLPREAYDDCLNLICSHSGNTEETIASFQEAIDHNLPCIGISSGGVIEEMCKEHGIPHVKLPIPFDNFQPRMATGHFVAVMMDILIRLGMIPDCRHDITEAAAQLADAIPVLEERGKELAISLVGMTPVVYSSTRFKSLAMIWKIKINENAKTPAFWNFFPELNHNEYVGFTNPQAPFHIIMLRDSEDHPRNRKRFAVTQKFLTAKGLRVTMVDMPEGALFYRIFATLALGDWMSYHLALAYKQDPTPVDMVEDFKKALD